MRNLLAGGKEVDRRDFLARADVLAACGMTVLISDYFQYYRLAAYLSWRTRERIAIVMGVPSVYELFDEKYYADLPGGILENFGRLFKNDLKIYVYPKAAHSERRIRNYSHRAGETRSATAGYSYLLGRGSFVQLDNYNPKYLPIFSRDVLNASLRETKPGTRWCRRKFPRSSADAASSDTRKVKTLRGAAPLISKPHTKLACDWRQGLSTINSQSFRNICYYTFLIRTFVKTFDRMERLG